MSAKPPLPPKLMQMVSSAAWQSGMNTAKPNGSGRRLPLAPATTPLPENTQRTGSYKLLALCIVKQCGVETHHVRPAFGGRNGPVSPKG